MRVQVNLLPDVKLEFIKARRMKRLVVTAAVIAAGVSLLLFAALFFTVNVVQQRHISNLDADIEQGVAEIQAIPDIDKVLTIQNQLNSLTQLHEEKPAVARYLGYLSEVTPTDASISETQLDFETETITMTGSAKSLEVVNKFADTLKFTTYTVKGSDQEAQNAFYEVVLGSFAVASDSDASYELQFKFNPEIFDNTKQIELKIPDIISTRSQTEKPSDLFKQTGGNTGEEQ